MKKKSVPVLGYREWKQKSIIRCAVDYEYTRNEGVFIEGAIDLHEKGGETIFFSDHYDLLNCLFEQTDKETVFLVFAGDIAEYPRIIQLMLTDERLQSIEMVDPLYSGKRVVQLKFTQNNKTVVISDMAACLPPGTPLKGKNGKKGFMDTFAPEYAAKYHDVPNFAERDYNPTTDKDYLQNDVEGLTVAANNFASLIENLFGVPIAVTAAGTALRAWQHTIPKGHKYFRMNKQAESFCRQAYFGGYCHPGYSSDVQEDIEVHDRKAAYGYIMKGEYPTGNPIYSEQYQGHMYGIWECSVTVKDQKLQHLPMVPYRVHHALYWLGRLGDTCTTHLTNEEINFLRQHGYEIIVKWGYYWEKTERPFLTFIELCEKLEKLGGVYKEAAKLMRNSLYGKFGMRPISEKIIISRDEIPENSEPLLDEKTGVPYPGLFVVLEEVDSPCIMPHWAAFITARQRLCIFEQVLSIGIENNAGIATDSIKHHKGLGNFVDTGEYGCWTLENCYKLYRSLGPNNWVSDTSIKVKGIPKKYLTSDMMIAHMKRASMDDSIFVRFSSPTHTRTMLKNNGCYPLVKEQGRSMRGLHSAKWELDEKNRFIPVYNPANQDQEQEKIA